MEFKKYKKISNNFIFIIDEDLPEVGATLYILKDKKVVEDHLQDSIQMCKDYAFDYFNVSYDNWEELTDLSDYPWLKD